MPPNPPTLSHHHHPKRIVIGVAGGSAAGKTTLCQNISRQMAFDSYFTVQIVSLDCFYKSIDTTKVSASSYNFDHPRAIDFDLAYQTVLALIKADGSQKVPIPQYSFTQHRRLQTPTYANSSSNIIMVEGLMAFYDRRLRDIMNYKIFISCDDDIRLCRRIKRDTTQRGRSIQSVLLQYKLFVKNSFRDFILPSSVYADLIVPGFRSNRVSVDFIVQHIKNIARKIHFIEKISKSRLYFFGDNEYFDLTHRDDSLATVVGEIYRPTFCVFPSQQQQRAQLQFFLDRLLAQAYSMEYWGEIIQQQIIRIARKLIVQLAKLKGWKEWKVTLWDGNSTLNDNNSTTSNNNNTNHKNKSPHIILIPFLSTSLFSPLLSTLPYSQPIVIISIFSSMYFPNYLYRSCLDDIVFINLYLMASQQRLVEVLKRNWIGRGQDSDSDEKEADLVKQQGSNISVLMMMKERSRGGSSPDLDTIPFGGQSGLPTTPKKGISNVGIQSEYPNNSSKAQTADKISHVSHSNLNNIQVVGSNSNNNNNNNMNNNNNNNRLYTFTAPQTLTTIPLQILDPNGSLDGFIGPDGLALLERCRKILESQK